MLNQIKTNPPKFQNVLFPVLEIFYIYLLLRYFLQLILYFIY